MTIAIPSSPSLRLPQLSAERGPLSSLLVLTNQVLTLLLMVCQPAAEVLATLQGRVRRTPQLSHQVLVFLELLRSPLMQGPTPMQAASLTHQAQFQYRLTQQHHALCLFSQQLPMACTRLALSSMYPSLSMRTLLLILVVECRRSCSKPEQLIALQHLSVQVGQQPFSVTSRSQVTYQQNSTFSLPTRWR